MRVPEMILFDYGGTLLCEPEFDPRKGDAALFPLIKDNPFNVGFDEYCEFLTSLFDEIRGLRGEYVETHEHQFLRYVLEYFGITLTVPLEEAELAIFDAMSRPVKAPDTDRMLDYLRDKWIRTGIISNLCWSGAALEHRIREFFPNHEFEFIITSSEYVFRKPDRHIFELAVRKAGLPKESVWYCGNNIASDIVGAHASGLFPVFYDNKTVPHSERLDNDAASIDFEYLHISEWDDLTETLDRILSGR